MAFWKKLWSGIKTAAQVLVGLNAADVIDVNEADKIKTGIDIVDAGIKQNKDQ